MINLKNACEQIMLGNMKTSELSEYYVDSNIIYKQTSNLSIEFKPIYLINILNKFMNDDINNDEMIDWSLFVLMSGCYVPSEDSRDEDFDDVITIISEISAPEIDGVLTKNIAEKYISRLKKLS